MIPTQMTKFGHACVRLDKGAQRIVIDPGEMTPESGAWEAVDAVLITHEHFDHLAPERLYRAAAENPALAVYTCPGVARRLPNLGDRVRVVHQGESFSAAGFDVTVVGEKHHVSHPDVAPVDNVGFLVDGAVFHPGDALPVVEVPTLLVPGQAPWMTMPDLILYLRHLRPQQAFAMHDGLLNEWGLQVLDSMLEREATELPFPIRRLRVGESVVL